MDMLLGEVPPVQFPTFPFRPSLGLNHSESGYDAVHIFCNAFLRHDDDGHGSVASSSFRSPTYSTSSRPAKTQKISISMCIASC